MAFGKKWGGFFKPIAKKLEKPLPNLLTMGLGTTISGAGQAGIATAEALAVPVDAYKLAKGVEGGQVGTTLGVGLFAPEASVTGQEVDVYKQQGDLLGIGSNLADPTAKIRPLQVRTLTNSMNLRQLTPLTEFFKSRQGFLNQKSTQPGRTQQFGQLSRSILG